MIPRLARSAEPMLSIDIGVKMAPRQDITRTVSSPTLHNGAVKPLRRSGNVGLQQLVLRIAVLPAGSGPARSPLLLRRRRRPAPARRPAATGQSGNRHTSIPPSQSAQTAEPIQLNAAGETAARSSPAAAGAEATHRSCDHPVAARRAQPLTAPVPSPASHASVNSPASAELIPPAGRSLWLPKRTSTEANQLPTSRRTRRENARSPCRYVLRIRLQCKLSRTLRTVPSVLFVFF